jgi:S1-C subfamily serine protease
MELGSVIFAQLLVKADSNDEIAGLTEKYVNKFNNRLRDAGYNVPGSESSVFKEDAYPDTDFMIAGAIVEFDCSGERRKTCGIGVEWEVLDRRNNKVVYKLRARHEEMLLGKMGASAGAEAMLLGTLDSLMSREKFVASLSKSGLPVAPVGPAHEQRTIRACSAEPKKMPKGSEHALQATVLVKEKDGIGSGVFISPDGFILTAAHVVTADTVEIRTKNGKSYQADVLRMDEDKDVALLRLKEPPSETPCLPLDVGTAPAGEDVYALGSPAGEELSFSISRGIVSGARTIGGTSYVQTDAAINPGNSGGPLVNSEGRVMAIASWKVAHEKMEGLGFGVPSSTALGALGIVLGDHTDTVARSVERTPTDT